MPVKRKLDAHGDKIKMVVHAPTVLKKNTYYNIPTTLPLTQPPTKQHGAWYSYVPSCYYPIALVDTENNDALVQGRKQISLVITGQMDAVTEPASVVTGPMDGIYWFSAIKAHMPGTITLSFSCNDALVEPLSFEIQVVDQKPKKAIAALGKKILGSSSGEDNGMTTGPLSKNESPSPISITVVRTDAQKQELHRRSSRGTVHDIAKSPNNAVVTSPTSELDNIVIDSESVRCISDKASVSSSSLVTAAAVVSPLPGASIPYIDSVLPYPKTVTLTNETRLNSPLLSASGDGGCGSSNSSSSEASSSTNTSKCFEYVNISGPMMHAKISSTLISALLHDRESLAPKQCEYYRHSRNAVSGGGGSSSSTPVAAPPGLPLGFLLPHSVQKPTVLDLLEGLKQRCMLPVSQGGAGFPPAAAETAVARLLRLFEYFFEDHLLYPEERSTYRTALGRMKDHKQAFASHVGAYYYLRLLIMLVSSAFSPFVGNHINTTTAASTTMTVNNTQSNVTSASFKPDDINNNNCDNDRSNLDTITTASAEEVQAGIVITAAAIITDGSNSENIDDSTITDINQNESSDATNADADASTVITENNHSSSNNNTNIDNKTNTSTAAAATTTVTSSSIETDLYSDLVELQLVLEKAFPLLDEQAHVLFY